MLACEKAQLVSTRSSIVLKGGYLDREAPALSAAGLLGTCGSFSAVVPPPVEFANDKLQHVAISRATATERHTAQVRPYQSVHGPNSYEPAPQTRSQHGVLSCCLLPTAYAASPPLFIISPSLPNISFNRVYSFPPSTLTYAQCANPPLRAHDGHDRATLNPSAQRADETATQPCRSSTASFPCIPFCHRSIIGPNRVRHESSW